MGDAPFIAHVQIKLNRTHQKRCGGSIISKNSILTAAHCVFGIIGDDILVRVGSRYRNLGGVLHRVKEKIVHESYNNPPYSFDFAILKVYPDIHFVPNVKTAIKLPAQNEQVKDGVNAMVSGWGLTLKEAETNEKLRGVVLPIMKQNECRRKYPFLTDQMICAGYSHNFNRTCTGERIKKLWKVKF